MGIIGVSNLSGQKGKIENEKDMETYPDLGNDMQLFNSARRIGLIPAGIQGRRGAQYSDQVEVLGVYGRCG